MGASTSGLMGVDWRTILDASVDATFIVDSHGRILDANQTAVQRYGYSLDELKQMHGADLVPQDLMTGESADFHHLLRTGEIVEWRHRRKDGSELSVEISSHPIIQHGEQVIVSSARDISMRKDLVSTLQSRKHMLERILATEPGTVYIFDVAQRRSVFISHRELSTFGYTAEEIHVMGPDVFQVFHPDDLPAVMAHQLAWRDAADGETRSIEFRVCDKQGGWHWMISHETPFTHDDNGQVTEILGIAHDITERKLAEEALRHSEHKFATLFNLASLPAALAQFPSQVLVDVNDAWLQLFGYTKEEAIGKTLVDLGIQRGVAHRGSVADAADVVDSMRPQQAVRNLEQTVFAKSGKAYTVLTSVNVIAIDGQDYALTSVQDISERKRAEILLGKQNQVLNMIASGVSLPVTLTMLVRMIEDQAPGMLGSVLLVDEGGDCVRHGAAPNLPAELIAAVEGQPVGPLAGSCGTAVYRREAVYVENIATDPLWEKYKAPALAHGLHACWSTPIFDSQGQILGTFAMYYQHPGLPEPQHLHLIDTATHIAAIIISHYQAEKSLHDSKLRLAKAQQVAHMGFLEWNLKTNRVFCSDEIYAMYGVDPAEVSTATDFITKLCYPDDAAAVTANLDQAIRGEKKYDIDHRIRRPDGEVRWVHAQAELVTHTDGRTQSLIGTVFDITKRKSAEAQVQRLTQLYSALSQCNQAIVHCTNEAELLDRVCRDAVEFGGMQMAWIGMVDKTRTRIKPVASCGAGVAYLDGIEVLLDESDQSGRGPTATAFRTNQPFWCQDFQLDPATAAWHERAMKFGWVASAALPLERKGVAIGTFNLYSDTINAFDEPARNLLIEMAMDISFALERFISDDERRQEQSQVRKLSHVVQQSPNSIIITDLNAKIEYVNEAFVRTSGYTLAEVVGQKPNALQAGKTPSAVYNTIWAHLMRGESWRGELVNLRKDGTEYFESAYISPIRGVNGEVTQYLCIQEDITERKRAEERIQYLANYDALTGLPNRGQLEHRLKYGLSLARRSNGRMAVMFVDIDRFKDINDTLGHSVGDVILIEVAKRLKSVLREEDTASRSGGDEFIILLPGCDAQGATQVAQKLLQVISKPYRSGQYDLVVTASIGVALYPDDGANIEVLSSSADTAMYRAKHEGRDCYRFFTAEMQTRVMRNAQLVNALRNALELGQLALHYQPQVSIDDGRIIGVEALLRWQHPVLGNVSPAEFIPVAEDSGLILPIGEWVLRTAAKQIKQWIDAGHPEMVMAVNLSAVQFRRPSLPDMVRDILHEEQLPMDCIALELTESVAMHDPQAAIAIMNKLYEYGIRMSIDDFGTGYSSLNYLKKFKVYKLKIDQSFVRDISTDSEDKAIVAAIISMSKNLGLQTIAEGVETAEQLAFLREQGCNEAQGYYYSKPLPADEFELFLAAARK